MPRNLNNGPSPMITLALYEKWLIDPDVDSFMCCFGLLYCKGLSNPEYLNTFKSSPNWRPWRQCTYNSDYNAWFPPERISTSLDKHYWELFLEHWYTVILRCENLEVKFSQFDGLGLYSLIKDVSVKTHLTNDWNTFLFDISIEKANNWHDYGFKSFYEYDGKLCALWGKWMLVNRSSKVTVGFNNLKCNGQTLQGILTLKTIEYEEINCDEDQIKQYDSLLKIVTIPPKHEYSLKNTQDIDEVSSEVSQSGTKFNCINKSYKIVTIEPWWDTTREVGCLLKRIGTQLFINYEEEDFLQNQEGLQSKI